jgi:hypothetical protein
VVYGQWVKMVWREEPKNSEKQIEVTGLNIRSHQAGERIVSIIGYYSSPKSLSVFNTYVLFVLLQCLGNHIHITDPVYILIVLYCHNRSRGSR